MKLNFYKLTKRQLLLQLNYGIAKFLRDKNFSVTFNHSNQTIQKLVDAFIKHRDGHKPNEKINLVLNYTSAEKEYSTQRMT